MKVSSLGTPALRAAAGHAAALLMAATLANPNVGVPPALAEAGEKRTIAEITTSGLVFKDTLRIEAFTDPKVKGVQLYLSDFSRPVTEKIAKGDIFSDPSNGGLTCSSKGKVIVSADASEKLEGEEVFSEARSLLFKSLKVRRIIDKEGDTVIYAVYSQRIDKSDDGNNSRFKSALCAVKIDEIAGAP